MSDQTQASRPKEALLPTDVERSDSLTALAPSSASASRRLCLLSNGTYSVMLSDSGSGFSRWRDLAVTRWREDATRDHWGSYLLLRDEDNGAAWSATRQPFGAPSQDVAVTFSDGRAQIVRREGTLDSALEIAVARDADVESRTTSVVSPASDTARAAIIAGLAGEAFKRPRDAGQFQHPRVGDDEVPDQGRGAHAPTSTSQPS